MSQERMNNDESRAKTPGLGAATPTPGISHVLTRTQRALDKVRVVHGANTKHFDLSGKTVGSVRKSLREVFNIPSEAVALVDGKEVQDDFLLQGGQNLEFNKEAGVKGSKASGNRMWYTATYFLLTLLTLFCMFKAFIGVLFFHPITALTFGCLTVFWGWLLCNNLANLIEDEQSNDP